MPELTLPLAGLLAVTFMLQTCTAEDKPEVKAKKAEFAAQHTRSAEALFKKNGFEIVGQTTTSSSNEYCYTLRKPANAAFTYSACYELGKITGLRAIEVPPVALIKP